MENIRATGLNETQGGLETLPQFSRMVSISGFLGLIKRMGTSPLLRADI